ncbi:MAG: hypothetical protein LBG72_08540 [Spirochaetaceae bacterium]|nr:hypothetical protein [Spirochaetaceae bacterium]
MDERLKSLRKLNDTKATLEKKMNEGLAALGQEILKREPEQSAGAEIAALFEQEKSLNTEIAGINEKISELEADAENLKHLETAVLAAKREFAIVTREALPLYRALGERMLQTEAPLQTEAGGLDIDGAARQARLLEERLSAARDRQQAASEGRKGFFGFAGAWAAKARENTLIKKTQAELSKLYTETGRSLAGNACASEGKVHELHEKALALENDLSRKQTEIAAIAGKWKPDGGQTAKLRTLKNALELHENSRWDIYIKAGREVSDVSKKDMYNFLLHSQDILAIEHIQKTRTALDEADDKIRKLKLSLEADVKQAQVEKLEKEITAKRRLISKLESEITALETRIFNTNKEIVRLGESD